MHQLHRRKKAAHNATTSETFNDDEEIISLRSRVLDEAPESGSMLSNNSTKLPFSSLPISRRTLTGLTAGKLTFATDIQVAAIPHALSGRDILGAAKTGSGKTLSFVIPLIDCLFRERWSPEDGLGALVISPTRELALQIFDVIRIVGRHHTLSAGLITGGKKEFEEEQQKIPRMNILVATPGRLLQHLEQTPGFEASSLQMLVLDEADRLLDMGFAHQLDAIMGYMPANRQTLLFSATQTKSVKDLARLSLRSPEYLSVHAEADQPTPQKLQQHYLVCDLQQKLDVLFSFLKSHIGSKIIVFMSTCSQVRFVFECFCGMQPGIPLVALHGKVKQERRTIIFMDYLRKKSACLFATDIAARGLDFPAVDWVVQLDAPEDASMYIHRVGRTARNQSSGRALMLLMPAEESKVLQELRGVGVSPTRLSMNPHMAVSVALRAAALLAEQPECRNLAKKAFSGYLRSLTLLPAARAIDPQTLPLDAYSASLGLAFTPLAPAMVTSAAAGRSENREKKNVNRALDKLKKQIKEAKEAKKAKKLLDASAAVVAVAEKKGIADLSQRVGNDEDEDDLLVVKRVIRSDDASGLDGEDGGDTLERAEEGGSTDKKTKKRIRPLRIRADGTVKTAVVGSRVQFDEGGAASTGLPVLRDGGVGMAAERMAAIDEHRRRVKARVDEGRQEDAQRDAERVRSRHRELRLRDKRDRREDSAGAVLENAVEEDEDEDDDGGSGSGSGSGDNSSSNDDDHSMDEYPDQAGDVEDFDDLEEDSDVDVDVDISLAEERALRMMR